MLGKVVLVQLTRHSSTWLRKNKNLTDQVLAEKQTQSKQAGRWTDTIINSNDPLIKPIIDVMYAADKYFKANSLHWEFQDGARLVAVERLGILRDYLLEAQQKLRELVAVASTPEHYTALLERERKRRGDLFNEQQYPKPEELHDVYGINIHIDLLPDVSAVNSLFGQSQENLKFAIEQDIINDLKKAKQAAVGDLGDRLAKPVQKLIDKMKRLNAGKEKKLHGSVLSNISDKANEVFALDIWQTDEIKESVKAALDLSKESIESLKGTDKEAVEARNKIIIKAESLLASLKNGLSI